MAAVAKRGDPITELSVVLRGCADVTSDKGGGLFSNQNVSGPHAGTVRPGDVVGVEGIGSGTQ